MRLFFSVSLILVSVVVFAMPLRAELYYYDGFDGEGLLHGSSPEVNLGGATWFANDGVELVGDVLQPYPDNAMTRSGGQLNVGIRDADFFTAGGSAATLPITLTPGATYTASATVHMTLPSFNEGWMYMSFTSNAEYSVRLNGGGSFDDRPVALALITDGGSYHSYASWQDIPPFANSGYAGDEGLAPANAGQPHTLGIRISVEADGSAALTYFNDGNEVIRNTPVFLTAEHAATVAGITIGRYVVGGTFDNFTLEVEGLLPPSQPGDFNGDGNVDGADFVIWQTNFPNNTGEANLAMGDANGDGNVDGADFVIWQTNFPTTAGATVQTVPEPASMLIMILGGSIALARLYGRRIVCVQA